MSSVLSDIESRLNLPDPESWYRVSNDRIIELGYKYTFSQHGSLYDVLRKYRPDFPWDESKFIGVTSFGDKLLITFLKQMFPNIEIISKYNFSDESEVTAFLPSLKLAFDFQTDRFYNVNHISGIHTFHLKIDEKKVHSAKRIDCEIIFVPFWWDRTLDTLLGTIVRDCPRALSEDSLVYLRNIKGHENLDIKAIKAIPKDAEVKLSSWRTRSRVAEKRSARL